MFAAGALAAGSFVWLSTQQLRDEVRVRNLEVAALKSRLQSHGLSERRLSAHSDEVQRLNRALAATDSALQQANRREEALRRRVAALTGGKPELVGPPVPQRLAQTSAPSKPASLAPPETLSAVQDRSANRATVPDAAGAVRLLSPVGTYLREDRPTINWTPVPDAAGYDMVVYTARGDEEAREIGIPEPPRTLARSLPRGKVYRWEIAASGGGRVIARGPGVNQPAALFGIVSEEQIQAELRIEAEARLSRAARLAKAGLLDEAEAELTALAEAPADSGIRRRARLLLDQIRSWRR